MRFLRSRLASTAPAGDDAAFRALFDAHWPFVWRVLRRHGVPEHELDDACQEVFLVVHRRLAEFEGRSKLQTWLYGIAIRVSLAARRRARRTEQPCEATEPEPARDQDPFQHALRLQALRELEAALSAISDAQREVFVLYELEGLSLAEVAEALGVPENTVWYRLHAAREAVTAHMRKRELKVQTRHAQKRVKGVAR